MFWDLPEITPKKKAKNRVTGTIDDLPAVAVSKRVFDELLDYSCSIPTGQTIGRWWKCRRDYHDVSEGWLVACYAECREDPTKVRILRRRLTWYPWVEDHAPVNAEEFPALNEKASFH